MSKINHMNNRFLIIVSIKPALIYQLKSWHKDLGGDWWYFYSCFKIYFSSSYHFLMYAIFFYQLKYKSTVNRHHYMLTLILHNLDAIQTQVLRNTRITPRRKSKSCPEAEFIHFWQDSAAATVPWNHCIMNFFTWTSIQSFLSTCINVTVSIKLDQ